MWYPMPAFSFSDSFLNHEPHEVGKYYGYGYVSVNGVVYKSPIKTPDRLKSEQLAAEKALAMLGVIKAPDRLKSEQLAAEKALSMLGVVKKARKEDTPGKARIYRERILENQSFFRGGIWFMEAESTVKHSTVTYLK